MDERAEQFASLMAKAPDETTLRTAMAAYDPILEPILAMAAKLSTESLEHLSGMILLLAYARRRAGGSFVDEHEMRHLRMGWMAGDSTLCRPGACVLDRETDA